jgi:DNA-binding transcriptional ArsR family regulator
LDPISAAFGALADRRRRSILARIAAGEDSLKALAHAFGISLQAVSKHLKVLERAGLIERGRVAQSRPCRIRPAGVTGVEAWLANYRQLWDEHLDRLDDHLPELQSKESARAAKK